MRDAPVKTKDKDSFVKDEDNKVAIISALREKIKHDVAKELEIGMNWKESKGKNWKESLRKYLSKKAKKEPTWTTR